MTDNTPDARGRISRRGVLSVLGSAGAAGTLAYWIGSEQGAAAEQPEQARDFPLSSILPPSYTAGRDDIAPYVQKTLDRLQPEGRASLLLPPGLHLWDSPCHLAADTTELTYELRGHGRGTVVELGPHLAGGFAIHLNENARGEQVVRFPRHPRLRLTDMYVTATSSDTGASLCRSSQASVDVQRVRFRHLKYGVTCSGYTDLVSLRLISWEQPAVDGRLYLMEGVGGDGLVLEQITASGDAVVAELTGCNGATITSCIGGRFIISDSDAIEVVAAHFDSHGPDSPVVEEPFVVVRSSRVAFRGGWDHVGPNAAAFEIDDSERDRYSEITWDAYSFGFRLDQPDKERAPDIRIRAAQPDTKLRFRGCSGRLLPSGRRERWAVGPRLVSDDGGIQAAIDAAPTAPLEDADLVRDAEGWTFEPSPAGPSRPAGPAPRIDRCTQTDQFPGDFRPGSAYHYTVAAYASFAPGQAADGHRSPEATTTIDDGKRAVALDVTVGRARAALRVWRGTQPGRYDTYADLAVGAFTTRLVDTGGLLCGVRWTRGSVPPPPPAGR